MAIRNLDASDGRAAASSMSLTVRVPKTAELVAGQLRRQIVRGELKEGDALPSETALMERFGVSRPALREAFRVLESERLITIRRGSHGGARVHVPNGDVAARYAGLVLQYRGTTLADVLEARAVLEPPCAARVASHRTPADLQRLHAAVADADAAVDDPNLSIHLQQEFHSLVVELTRSETVKVMIGMLGHIIDTATFSKVAREAGTPGERAAQHAGHRSHARLVEYIEAGDSAGAERLWRKHITQTTAFLTEGPTASTVLELFS